MTSIKISLSILLVYIFSTSPSNFFATSTRLHSKIANSNGDLISSTCSHTLYNEICMNSLKSDPRSASADVQDLANIAIDVTRSYGVETLSHISHLKSNVAKNGRVSSCLGVCMEVYNDAIDELKEAIEALKSKAFEDLKTFVSTAMTDSDTCEESFEEIQSAGYEFPISLRNLYFSKLCSNALAITSLVS